MIYQLKIDGVTPNPKGRLRASVVAGHAHIYTPETTRAYEHHIHAAWEAEYPGVLVDVPCVVRLRFRMPIVQSASKRVREAMLRGDIAHTKRPDTDNLIKSVLDGLQGDDSGLADDCRIIRIEAEKIYSDTPGIDIIIETVRDTRSAASWRINPDSYYPTRPYCGCEPNPIEVMMHGLPLTCPKCGRDIAPLRYPVTIE